MFIDADAKKPYYFAINATNSANKDAELRWQGVSGPETLIVPKNTNGAKEAIVTSATLPQPYVVTAVEKGTNNAFTVNGIESVNVPLSLMKQPTFLTITDGMLNATILLEIQKKGLFTNFFFVSIIRIFCIALECYK